MESITIPSYADIVFNRFGQFGQTKPIATTTFNKNHCDFSSGFARVAALYPSRKAGNAFTVKLSSHAKEMKESVEYKFRKELTNCTDRREAAIIWNAQKAAGLFRVRGC
jgi:hypothetical protein